MIYEYYNMQQERLSRLGMRVLQRRGEFPVGTLPKIWNEKYRIVWQCGDPVHVIKR